MEDHRLTAVRYCFFTTFAVTTIPGGCLLHPQSDDAIFCTPGDVQLSTQSSFKFLLTVYAKQTPRKQICYHPPLLHKQEWSLSHNVFLFVLYIELIVFTVIHFLSDWFLYYLMTCFKFYTIHSIQPIPRAARSETRTVFGRSNIEIVGSKPTRGMYVCRRFSV
jgi:hypothetical protein